MDGGESESHCVHIKRKSCIYQQDDSTVIGDDVDTSTVAIIHGARHHWLSCNSIWNGQICSENLIPLFLNKSQQKKYLQKPLAKLARARHIVRKFANRTDV